MRSAFVSLVVLLCIACASAATCPAGTVSFPLSLPATAAPKATKLIFNNKLGFNADIQYVSTTSSTPSVDVSGCVTPTIAKRLGFAWTSTADSYTLTANSDGTFTTTTGDAPVQVSPNGASKSGIAPITTFAALAFGLLLVLRPKSASSVVLLMAILGVAMYAQADTTSTITIKISLPDSILSTCNSDTDCTVRGPGSVPYVNVVNDRYATMDLGTACDTSKVMNLPDNWRIASTADATVFAAIYFNTWDTKALILADGTAYTNNKNNVVYGSNAFTSTNGTGYQVTSCNTKILIVQKFPYANSNPSLVSVASITKFVTFNKMDYASVDNVAYDSSASGTQSGGFFIPSAAGWAVATDDDSAAVGLTSGSNIFGCECGVYANGNGHTGSFGPCGTAQLISVNVPGAGVVVAVVGLKQRVIVSRASNASNTFVTASTVSFSVVYTVDSASREFATLDNVDPYLVDTNACQSRFYAMPVGFALATNDQTHSFIQGSNGQGIYSATQIFVMDSGAVDRIWVPVANVTLLTKNVNGVTYYTTSSCARVLITRLYQPRTAFTMGLKLLFIHTSPDPNAGDIGEVNLFYTMMQATGILYEQWSVLNADGDVSYRGSLPLSDAAGNPKYYGIVMSTSDPKYSDNSAILTANQKNQLAQYQYLFGIRKVALNGNPQDWTAACGMTLAGPSSANGTTMSLLSTFTGAHPELFGGVNITGVYNTSGQYHTWIASPGSACDLEPMASLKEQATDASGNTVALIITDKTYRTQTMQFFIGNADFLDHGPVLANVWLTWVTRGIWLGNRRIYFSPQIDDYFLTTGQYGYPDTNKYSVRITGTDVDKTYAFLNNLNATVPTGSRVTLAMAVNCVEAPQAPTLVTAAKKYADYFFWESHTWSHLDLTHNPEELCDLPSTDPREAGCHTTTYDEASLELSKNNDWIAANLFPLNSTSYSRNSMITPAITGLFNPAALQALVANGMTCVVGDNSRKELLPENPYLGMWTTEKDNGATGVFIIPRYATEIYYNSATPDNNMRQYNERYGPNRLPQFPNMTFDYNSTLDQLLDREASNNFRHLAFFRHDPFMFHQCNLNHFSYRYAKDNVAQDWSLVTLWLRAVIDKYNSMLTFPLIGVKQQDLRDVYWARNSREVCGLSGSMTINNGQTTSVQLSSSGGCEASITGLSSCGSLGSSECRIEQYAADNTLWAQMVVGSTKQFPVTGKAWTN